MIALLANRAKSSEITIFMLFVILITAKCYGSISNLAIQRFFTIVGGSHHVKGGADGLGLPGTNLGSLPAAGGLPQFNFNGYSGIAELPFGRNKPFLQHGVGAALASGWQLNGVLTAHTGTPFSISADGTDLNAPVASSRPSEACAGSRWAQCQSLLRSDGISPGTQYGGAVWNSKLQQYLWSRCSESRFEPVSFHRDS
jgi:hypothetical protein